jgi:hypothetical protein
VLPPPPFPVGSPGLQAHAIDRANPLRWYVTDGRTVLASRDGGCRWEVVLALGADRPDDRVGALEVGPSLQGPGTVWVAIEQQHLPVPRVRAIEADPGVTSHLLRSDDGGGTWDAPAALPFPFGRTTHLLVAPADPDRVYAAVWGRLQVSWDRGASWQDRGFLPWGPGDYLIPPQPVGKPPDEVRDLLRHREDPQARIEHLVVDHHDPDRLWATSAFRVYTSPDAATTWQAGVDEPGRRLPVVVSRPEAAGTTIVPYHRYNGGSVSRYEVSEDSGTSWDLRPTESWGGRLAGSPQSATVGWRGGDVVLTTFDRGLPGAHFALSVYRLAEGTGRFVDIDEFGLAPLYDVQSDLAPTPVFFFRSADRLVIHVPFEREEAGGGAFDPGHGVPTPGNGDGLEGLHPGEPPQRITYPSLEPRPVRPPEPAEVAVSPPLVDLAVGEKQAVDVRVALPPRPTPLDLFVLFDSSDSTARPIRHLALELQALVDALAAEGVGLRIGIGTFTDYPFLPWGGAGDHPYRLHRRVAEPHGELPAELAAAHQPGAGSGTLAGSSALTALFQAATGAGQADPTPPGVTPAEDPSISAGQEAGFGPSAAPVVVTMTDVPFYDAAGHPGPDRADVLAALRERRIRQLGIATGAGGSGGGSVLARPDLEGTAEATGALARHPVACGGTGPDVAPGAPLVCSIDELAPEGIAAVTAALALALPDEGEVSVRTAEGGVGSGSPTLVDLHEGAPAIADQVVVACREGDPPLRTVDVEAVLARSTTGQSEVLGSAAVSVRCSGTQPVPPESAEPSPAPGAPAPANPAQPSPATPAPPPPPPLPVPATGPAPAPAAGPSVAASHVANPASAGAPAPAAGTAQGTAPVAGTAPGAAQGTAPAASPGAAPAPGGSPAQVAATPGGGGASPALSWGDAGRRAPLEAATVHDAANARTAAATLLMAGTSLLLRRHRAAGRLRPVRNRR